jgi:hypothetical protein
VCHYVHDKLIASRRCALEAIKRGFTYAADLRPGKTRKRVLLRHS